MNAKQFAHYLIPALEDIKVIEKEEDEQLELLESRI